jgi:glycosyltransferase involved in cell wall biosynthesis
MSKGKCLIVPNFIDDEDVVSKKSISNLIQTILFAGHLIRTKGIFELYAVAKLFPSITFILAGLVTSDVESQIAPDNVKLIGYVGKERMDELFALADLFLFPTYTEGFSMALLEAMARGLPIITTPVGANVEMLESCGGIVVAVGDVQGISNGIEFLQFKNVRETISNWNISKVRSDYCASKVVDRIMNIYNSIIVN